MDYPMSQIVRVEYADGNGVVIPNSLPYLQQYLVGVQVSRMELITSLVPAVDSFLIAIEYENEDTVFALNTAYSLSSAIEGKRVTKIQSLSDHLDKTNKLWEISEA